MGTTHIGAVHADEGTGDLAGLSFREHVEEPGLVTLTVLGEVDHRSTALLEAALANTLDRWPDEVVVDLRRVTFINARGLGCLLEVSRTARVRRQRLVLSCRPGLVARMVVLVGLGDQAQIELSAGPADRSTTSVSDAPVDTLA